MAGFPFGGGHHQQRGDGAIPPSDQGFFLYSGRGESSSEEPGYTRGFELYQIQREPGQLYSSAAGYADELAVAAARAPMRVAGGVSCQDCGNQAKKDCVHLRCRTCCKSRGYPCPTHVKSTWVPAEKRRERQEQLAATAAAAAAAGDQAQHRRGGETSGGTESSKRPRELAMGCTRIATTTSSTYGGTLDREGLPPEVSAEAMFRCVRVSPVDEADDEFAYQTTVSIGGHVFKGILYDHGADTDHPSSSSTSHFHALPHSSHNARAAAEAAEAAEAAAAVSSAAPSDMLEPYPTPLSAFMAGTQFYPHQHRP